MKKIILGLLVTVSFHVHGQVDHWESILIQGDQYQYLLPAAELDVNWTTLGYDDSAWSAGNSGFGYGDDDDNQFIAPTISVYLRRTFTVVDLAVIDDVLFHMDYDDGFVAYLNGTEIARAVVTGTPPAYDQGSGGLHEAVLYTNTGQIPDEFIVDKSLLNEGENVLAVQVHNESLTSSDLTAIPFFSVGINNETVTYQATPSWFGVITPPLDFQSSNLPILILDSNGQTVSDDPKVSATMKIIYNGPGQINRITDEPTEFTGYCGIEIRGNSSQSFAKKNYGIAMTDANGVELDTSFLNFPAEEDFTLHGPYSDKSLLNNVLAMKLGNDLGQYASRTRMVEMTLNGEYMGVYVIMEKIKRSKNRVNIAKLEETEIAGDDLTGGYIIRFDRYDDWNDGWDSKYNAFASDTKIHFNIITPDPNEIPTEQRTYIQNYVDDFEEAIASTDYTNSEGKHYTKYIKLRTFVDNFLLNELSKNVDAYRLSTYFHKDKDSKGGKINAGPFWDFNLAFGNGDYCSGDDVTGWEYYQCTGSSPFWWDRMLKDTLFNNAMRCRWESLRSTTLSTATVNNFLDSMATSISEAQARNFQKWPVMGTYVWPNPPYYANAQSHDEVMTVMKQWIKNRSEWLDANIPGVAQHCDIYDNFEPEPQGDILGIGGNNSNGNESQNISYSIYPNPTESVLNISSNQVILEVLLTDILGRQVGAQQINRMDVTLNVEGHNPGVYLVTIKTKSSIHTEQIFIE